MVYTPIISHPIAMLNRIKNMISHGLKAFPYSKVFNPWIPEFIKPRFLIVAPDFTHRSAGVRALYRLCHHLNQSGYLSAVIPIPGNKIKNHSPWKVFGYNGSVDGTVVIYPEIISGNPYKASKVVRWVLNDPGLLGGEKHYDDNEVVFVYDPNKIEIVNKAIKKPVGAERVLWVGVVDPDIIYPDLETEKIFDCSFTSKGHALANKFPIDPSSGIKRLEDLTPDYASLGDVLRKTSTLYSFDHYSNLLREAFICGCDVKVINEKGVWHDPTKCDCKLNIVWHPEIREIYKTQFYDSSVVDNFIAQLPSSWSVKKSPWYLRKILLSNFIKPDHLSYYKNYQI
jgi:hypothetical protein